MSESELLIVVFSVLVGAVLGMALASLVLWAIDNFRFGKSYAPEITALLKQSYESDRQELREDKD
jgi:hypothetical protein